MPALLFPLLLIAAAPAPEIVELRGVTILGHGTVPPASGVLHTLLRIDVRDAGGAPLSFYRTYLGPADVPETGAKCDLSYRTDGIGSGVILEGTKAKPGQLIVAIRCQAPLPRE